MAAQVVTGGCSGARLRAHCRNSERKPPTELQTNPTNFLKSLKTSLKLKWTSLFSLNIFNKCVSKTCKQLQQNLMGLIPQEAWRKDSDIGMRYANKRYEAQLQIFVYCLSHLHMPPSSMEELRSKAPKWLISDPTGSEGIANFINSQYLHCLQNSMMLNEHTDNIRSQSKEGISRRFFRKCCEQGNGPDAGRKENTHAVWKARI